MDFIVLNRWEAQQREEREKEGERKKGREGEEILPANLFSLLI